MNTDVIITLFSFKIWRAADEVFKSLVVFVRKLLFSQSVVQMLLIVAEMFIFYFNGQCFHKSCPKRWAFLLFLQFSAWKTFMLHLQITAKFVHAHSKVQLINSQTLFLLYISNYTISISRACKESISMYCSFNLQYLNKM